MKIINLSYNSILGKYGLADSKNSDTRREDFSSLEEALSSLENIDPKKKYTLIVNNDVPNADILIIGRRLSSRKVIIRR